MPTGPTLLSLPVELFAHIYLALALVVAPYGIGPSPALLVIVALPAAYAYEAGHGKRSEGTYDH